VQRPAVFELLPNEALGDLLQMAGGFNAVADRTRVAIERLDDRATTRITQLEMPGKANTTLTSGDVVRAFSAVDAALPVQRQNKRVRIEGEVARPGDYVLPAQSTLADALAAAGGMTPSAFPFGSEFMRDSVRVTQQQNYERALRDLETELARASTSMRTATADEAAAQNARASSTTRLIDRLRAVKPTGRVVLQLPAGTKELPALALEDGDRLYIPPKPTSVGVFGSVFNAGSYLYDDGREVDDFLKLAGGPTRGADTRSVFVVRANGSVVSGRDRSSWWSDDTGLERVRAEPGDTIFVPEEWNKTTWTQHAKDWGQIVSQFGLGIAAILAITR
jgi:protein involved in polysaccharide export with SLBB domain